MRHWLSRLALVATRRSPVAAQAVCLLALCLTVSAAPFATAAESQRVENRKAVFAALDKVTARISKLEAKLGETVRFGALKVTPRACYSRPPTEPPKTSTFVEIDEVLLDGKEKRIFTGWMFAESPGLHALEHPVFDVWLTACADPRNAPVAQTASPGNRGEPAPAPDDDDAFSHRRFRPRR
ncbi:MAG: DUF2155 domain-containing protein [Hyphomicrobiaceae bacterium]